MQRPVARPALGSSSHPSPAKQSVGAGVNEIDPGENSPCFYGMLAV
jgi:hypothetical protein